MEEPVPNQEPSTDLEFGRMDVVGIELHEIYLALQRAGFSEKEALFVVGIAVAEGAMSPRRYYSPEDEEDTKDDDFPDDGDFDTLF